MYGIYRYLTTYIATYVPLPPTPFVAEIEECLELNPLSNKYTKKKEKEKKKDWGAKEI